MDIYTQIECWITGTEEEIEQADKKFKELAKDSEMFEALDNAKEVYDDSIYIYADPERPIFADGVQLEAVDIQDDLFSEFIDLDISLEGYDRKYIKKKGTSEYEEELFPVSVYTSMQTYKEETNEIETFTYPFGAYWCDVDVDVFRDENGLIENHKEVQIEGKDGGLEVFATFDGGRKMFETNVDLYDKESDSFTLVEPHGNEKEIEVPGELFKNEKGKYESKQVFFEDDSEGWILVHLVMTGADENQLNGSDQGTITETKPKVIKDLGKITTKDVCVEIDCNIKELKGLDDSEVFSKSRYALEKIIVDDNHPSYWTDGKAIFSKDKKTLYKYMAYNDKEYTIPDGTEVISDNCFCNMDNLETVKLPSSIKKLGCRAFSECTKLNNLEGLEDIEHIEEFDGFCIDRIPFCDENEVIIIGNILFKNETKDEKVIKVPEGITEIFNFMPTDSALFMPEEPDLLEEVILPSTLKKIDREAFVKRTNLKKTIIPNGVEEIGQGAFEDCFGLESINIPSTVKTIDTMFTFPKNSPWGGEDTPFKSIDVDPSNKNYCSIDGMLYSKDKKTMLHVPAKSFKEKIVIPKEVEVIASYCFDNYSDSTPIEIEFEEGSQLKVIEPEAFMDLVIDSVTIPEGTETIRQEAFYRGEINKVSLPKQIESVEKFAFSRAEEIEVYDTMDSDCGDAYDIEVVDWDTPETEVPMMGMRIDYDYNWNDHTITVKSAETDEIKYKVWMGAEGEDQEYQGILMFGWGHNATFAFKEQDAFFDKLEVEENKLIIAKYRLSYPIDLTEEMKNHYVEFLKDNGCDDKDMNTSNSVITMGITEKNENLSTEKETKIDSSADQKEMIERLINALNKRIDDGSTERQTPIQKPVNTLKQNNRVRNKSKVVVNNDFSIEVPDDLEWTTIENGNTPWLLSAYLKTEAIELLAGLTGISMFDFPFSSPKSIMVASGYEITEGQDRLNKEKIMKCLYNLSKAQTGEDKLDDDIPEDNNIVEIEYDDSEVNAIYEYYNEPIEDNNAEYLLFSIRVGFNFYTGRITATKMGDETKQKEFAESVLKSVEKL